MPALYNEFEPFAAAWMRELILKGCIASGVVNEQSIATLAPGDVNGPGQRHFFAGIGGWSHALRLAGISDELDIWTGSCPCQPFSTAGKKLGTDDPRHLWPVWFSLIKECRPPVIFGEQVASADGLHWLDLVSSDLENAGYAFGASDLCAAGVGAPHIRQRLYFVAYADGERLNGVRLQLRKRGPQQASVETDRGGAASVMGDASEQGGGGDARTVSRAKEEGEGKRVRAGDLAYKSVPPGATGNFWGLADYIKCRPEPGFPEGRWRPVEPGTFPLAHGVPAQVGRLRGYGNAIIPQVAATFIRASLEAIQEAE